MNTDDLEIHNAAMEFVYANCCGLYVDADSIHGMMAIVYSVVTDEY